MSLPASRENHVYEYVAFVSYKHGGIDEEAASWLHRTLESYRVPWALTRRGLPRRLGRVFRDEEEMEASPDLGDRLRNALDRSRHLILVASPRSADSEWVRAEIEYFQSLGRGDRIFCLLADGEPTGSIPEILGEPLAADYRPNPARPLRALRRQAALRLIAPIVGCSYDDLAQRDQTRRRRRATFVSAATIALLVFVGRLASSLAVAKETTAVERSGRHALTITDAALDLLERGRDEEAAFLAAAAYRIDEDSQGLNRAQARSVLSRVLDEPHFVRTLFSSESSTPTAACLGRDGVVVMGAADGRGLESIDPATARLVRWRTGAGGDEATEEVALESPVGWLALDPTGQRVHGHCMDGQLRTWAMEPFGELLGEREIHAPIEIGLALSPDGDRLAFLVEGERRVRVISLSDPSAEWNLAIDAPEAHATDSGVEDSVILAHFAFGLQGRRLAVSFEDFGRVDLFDLENSGEPRASKLGSTENPALGYVALSLDASGELVSAVGSDTGKIYTWDLRLGNGGHDRPTALGEGGTAWFAGDVRPAATSALLATWTPPGLMAWERERPSDLVDTGIDPQALRCVQVTHSRALLLSHESVRLVYLGGISRRHQFDSLDVDIPVRYSGPASLLSRATGGIRDLAFDPSSEDLAITHMKLRTARTGLHVWGAADPSPEAKALRGVDSSSVRVACFSSSGRIMAVGAGRAVYLLDTLEPSAGLRKVVRLDDEVLALAFAGGEDELFAGTGTRTMQRYTGGGQLVHLALSAQGVEEREVAAFDHSVTSLAVTPGGMVYVGDAGGAVVECDPHGSVDTVRVLADDLESVVGITSDDTGHWLAAGGTDGTLRLWDLNREEAGARTIRADTIHERGGALRDLVFRPGTQELTVAAGEDRSAIAEIDDEIEQAQAYIADLQPGFIAVIPPSLFDGIGEALLIQAPVADPAVLAWHPDGRTLAVGGGDFSVWVGVVAGDALVEHARARTGARLRAEDWTSILGPDVPFLDPFVD